MLKLMSAREAADKWGISQRRVAVLCAENRIKNEITKKTINIKRIMIKLL